MPFFLLIFGTILIVAAYRKKQGELFDLLKDDFFGDNNFIIWTMAIVILVAVGNIKQIKPISDAMLVLIILVIIVKNYRDNQDILTMFVDQVKRGTGTHVTVHTPWGDATQKSLDKLVKSFGK